MAVFEDFRYVREIGADGARDHALVFEARVGDKQIGGMRLHPARRGRRDQRVHGHGAPACQAALALAEAMKAQLSSV